MTSFKYPHNFICWQGGANTDLRLCAIYCTDFVPVYAGVLALPGARFHFHSGHPDGRTRIESIDSLAIRMLESSTVMSHL
ncbi:MAG: hypothetical protein F4X14_01525 [Caldilineaceae bacterium SB0661_bin_32]|uniref:Uncharacterized protein n=1 Tax=Caldilineaceae bacterium SB0661_bin_32 TaxID=2605255 RepID=A0A6B1D2A2_9CHLR|nr:hypothetical protein [Caldilineaceae bacterium SB0661_bin_32]